MMRKITSLWQLATESFATLKANDPIRMAAATAFFSFFALPPIVIILSQLYGRLFNERNQRASWQLFRKLAELFGNQGARQLQDISQHLQQRQSSVLSTVLSGFLLLLASTTLFAIVKNSLNQLWNVKPAADRQFWYTFLDRGIALGIIIFAGFLVTISLVVQQFFLRLNTQPVGGMLANEWLHNAGQHAFSVLLLTSWFAVIFKFLPNIRIRWQAVWVGALVTGLLTEIGEQVLDQLLIKSPVSSLYGNSGAIILVLLFVFYSAIIFYYGASFTRHYAQWINLAAEPGAHAVAYQINEVDNPETDSAQTPPTDENR